MRTLDKLNIGERMEDLRRKHTNYTQEEFAHKAGLNANTIRSWKFINNPEIRSIDACTDVLGITLSEFFKLDDEKHLMFKEEELKYNTVRELKEELDKALAEKYRIQDELTRRTTEVLELTRKLANYEKNVP